ncbi:MAG: FAD-dependent oxidoreductase, partial [Gammaproteobacteria bacterium]|nr:FAD-dependent oxidoreductase [Gammaproteobacteria bacterium]
MRYVIVGAGPAGVTAAEALRRIDPKGSITVVGDEPEPPYSRMAIPYLLTGRIGEQGTHLRKAPDYFAKQAIQIVRGRVSRVMPEERTVQLEEGSTMGFDRLLIATGSRPLMPRVPGGDLPG